MNNKKEFKPTKQLDLSSWVNSNIKLKESSDQINKKSIAKNINRKPKLAFGYGYNPENPNERKIGMPVFYPFTIENEKFMPIINPVIEKYSPTQVYFRVYRNKSKTNTDLHQLEVEFKVFDKNGNSIIVKGVDLVKGPRKIDSKVFSYLFVFDLVEPQSGLYQLQVTLTDNLNKQIASSRTPFFAIKE